MPGAGLGPVPGVDDAAWVHTTPRLVGFGHDFRVRTMDAELGRFLDDVYGAMAQEGAAASHVYSLLDRGPSSAGPRFGVYIDGDVIADVESAHDALGYLIWHVNQSVAASVEGQVVLHAAALDHGGHALVLPGRAGAGKTTLAAGLLGRGLRYLSDEAVAVDGSTTTLRGYAKPLSLGPGSQGVLAHLEPAVHPEVGPYVGDDWHLAPAAFGPDRVVATSAPRFVIAPRYEPGAVTALEPLRRAEAVTVLAANSFNFHALGADGLLDLAAMVRVCDCYRLVVGDLSEACDLLEARLGWQPDAMAC
jgi:HprK-related kinase A